MKKLLHVFLKVTLVVLLAMIGFFLGWKSYSADKRAVQEMVSGGEMASALLPMNRQFSKGSQGLTELEKVRAALRFNDGTGLGEARAYLEIEDWSSSQLAEAFASAIGQPRTASGDRLIDMILDRWAKVDPAAAVSACSEAFLSDRERFLNRARMPLHHLAKKDPAAAFEAWRAHWEPLDKDYDDATEFQLTGVFSAWADQDLESALSQVESAALGEATGYAVKGILTQAMNDAGQLEKAFTWLESQGDQKMLDEGREAVVSHLTRTGKVDEAIAWVDALEIGDVERAPLENELAGNWFHEDQHAATEWLLARSDDANRSDRIKEFARDWADWEANAAADWLGEMMARYGSQADAGVGAFARQVASKDPAAALEWLGAITDPDLRVKTAGRLAEDWSRRQMRADVLPLLVDSSLAERELLVIEDRLK